MDDSLNAKFSNFNLPIFVSNFDQLNMQIVSGQEGDNPQGWTTDGIGKRHPIQTLVATLDADSDTTMAFFFFFNGRKRFSNN